MICSIHQNELANAMAISVIHVSVRSQPHTIYCWNRIRLFYLRSKGSSLFYAQAIRCIARLFAHTLYNQLTSLPLFQKGNQGSVFFLGQCWLCLLSKQGIFLNRFATQISICGRMNGRIWLYMSKHSTMSKVCNADSQLQC